MAKEKKIKMEFQVGGGFCVNSGGGLMEKLARFFVSVFRWMVVLCSLPGFQGRFLLENI